MKRPKVLLLNLSGIGCRSTSKMAAQSHSQGINQQKCVRLFFDILICCLDIGILSWRVSWKTRNPEFRRNSAVISPEFFDVRFF